MVGVPPTSISTAWRLVGTPRVQFPAVAHSRSEAPVHEFIAELPVATRVKSLALYVNGFKVTANTSSVEKVPESAPVEVIGI